MKHIMYLIRYIILVIILLANITTVFAQSKNKKPLQKRENYEFTFDLPRYVEQLKKELTYPLAWGNSDIKNFAEWKSVAKAKVLECMMTPPMKSAAYDMQVIGEEKRKGYTAMDKIKITREEALRRWNSAKETKRRMVERLEVLARESYKDQTGEYPVEVEVW